MIEIRIRVCYYIVYYTLTPHRYRVPYTYVVHKLLYALLEVTRYYCYSAVTNTYNNTMFMYKIFNIWL